MALLVATATLADDAAFAAFNCWDPNTDAPWVEETENYIRGALLRQPDNHTLAFRDGDALVAVSSFYKSSIELPLVQPDTHPTWHLDVVAITLDRQGDGHSLEVYQGTLRAMRKIDSGPVLVTARAHEQNDAAFESAKHIGLFRLYPWDDSYWVLLGELAE